MRKLTLSKLLKLRKRVKLATLLVCFVLTVLLAQMMVARNPKATEAADALITENSTTNTCTIIGDGAIPARCENHNIIINSGVTATIGSNNTRHFIKLTLNGGNLQPGSWNGINIELAGDLTVGWNSAINASSLTPGAAGKTINIKAPGSKISVDKGGRIMSDGFFNSSAGSYSTVAGSIWLEAGWFELPSRYTTTASDQPTDLSFPMAGTTASGVTLGSGQGSATFAGGYFPAYDYKDVTGDTVPVTGSDRSPMYNIHAIDNSVGGQVSLKKTVVDNVLVQKSVELVSRDLTGDGAVKITLLPNGAQCSPPVSTYVASKKNISLVGMAAPSIRAMCNDYFLGLNPFELRNGDIIKITLTLSNLIAGRPFSATDEILTTGGASPVKCVPIVPGKPSGNTINTISDNGAYLPDATPAQVNWNNVPGNTEATRTLSYQCTVGNQ